MAGQGCVLTESEVRKIVVLLASTEMTIGEIATRMGRSRSTIVNVNREYQVREYAGLRTQWRSNLQTVASD